MLQLPPRALVSTPRPISNTITAAVVLACCGAFVSLVSGQVFAAQRVSPSREIEVSPLPQILKVEWKEPPHSRPLTDATRKLAQDALASPNLRLGVYGVCAGPGVLGVEVYAHPNFTAVWTGMCASPVAVTLQDTRYYLDLTGAGKIRWMARSINLHAVRPVLQLRDGTLIVGDYATISPASPEQFPPQMLEVEFAVAPMRWYRLNATTLATAGPVTHPDLSKVDAVGFADLMPSGGHGNVGWDEVGDISVFGRDVPR